MLNENQINDYTCTKTVACLSVLTTKKCMLYYRIYLKPFMTHWRNSVDPYQTTLMHLSKSALIANALRLVFADHRSSGQLGRSFHEN